MPARTSRIRRADPQPARCGAAIGLAALCFISNLLFAVSAAVALTLRPAQRGESKRRLLLPGSLLVGTAATLGAGSWLGWLLIRPARSYPVWLGSYSGSELGRLESVYGPQSAGGMVESVTRALYGAASAIVDLAPAVVAVRDQGLLLPAVLRVAVILVVVAALGVAAVHVLREWRAKPNRRCLLINLVWWPVVLLFGIYWNNSDDQFYFQLAVPVGCLAARLPLSRAIAAGGVRRGSR